jgi:hypothetical protein
MGIMIYTAETYEKFDEICFEIKGYEYNEVLGNLTNETREDIQGIVCDTSTGNFKKGSMALVDYSWEKVVGFACKGIGVGMEVGKIIPYDANVVVGKVFFYLVLLVALVVEVLGRFLR